MVTVEALIIVIIMIPGCLMTYAGSHRFTRFGKVTFPFLWLPLVLLVGFGYAVYWLQEITKYLMRGVHKAIFVSNL